MARKGDVANGTIGAGGVMRTGCAGDGASGSIGAGGSARACRAIGAEGVGESGGRPDILCFVADELRADALHHLGCAASITPNLDRIPREDGVSFESAYCQNPVCVPSRCSFLTGLYPHTTGHRTMQYLQRGLDEPNMLKAMKDAGYEVIWLGRNDVIRGDADKTPYCDAYFDGVRPGDVKAEPEPFDPARLKRGDPPAPAVPGPELYSFHRGRLADGRRGFGAADWGCVEALLASLDRIAVARAGCSSGRKPFFIYCSLIFPHPPYCCEDPWFSAIDRRLVEPPRPRASGLHGKAGMLAAIEARQGLDGWGAERFVELRATYLAMVSRFDAQFGMVADRLRALGLYDGTSIFVWSDHGDYTGDYGIVEKAQNTFEDPVSRVPLLVKPAVRFACRPRIARCLAELTDVSATVQDMAGVRFPWHGFGRSLLPAVGGGETARDCALCEGGRLHGERQAMEVLGPATSPYHPRQSVQAGEGPEHGKAVMIRMGNLKYTMRLYERDELYDLERDPLELENRIDDLVYARDVGELRHRLLERMVETADYVPGDLDPR